MIGIKNLQNLQIYFTYDSNKAKHSTMSGYQVYRVAFRCIPSELLAQTETRPSLATLSSDWPNDTGVYALFSFKRFCLLSLL